MFSPSLFRPSNVSYFVFSLTVQQDVMSELPYFIMLYMSTGHKGL